MFSGTSDLNASCGPAGAVEGCELAGREPDHGLWSVAHDDGVVPARAGELATVTGVLLHVEYRGPLGDVPDGEGVPDGDGSVHSRMKCLAHPEALVGEDPQ